MRREACTCSTPPLAGLAVFPRCRNTRQLVAVTSGATGELIVPGAVPVIGSGQAFVLDKTAGSLVHLELRGDTLRRVGRRPQEFAP